MNAASAAVTSYGQQTYKLEGRRFSGDVPNMAAVGRVDRRPSRRMSGDGTRFLIESDQPPAWGPASSCASPRISPALQAVGAPELSACGAGQRRLSVNGQLPCVVAEAPQNRSEVVAEHQKVVRLGAAGEALEFSSPFDFSQAAPPTAPPVAAPPVRRMSVSDAYVNMTPRVRLASCEEQQICYMGNAGASDVRTEVHRFVAAAPPAPGPLQSPRPSPDSCAPFGQKLACGASSGYTNVKQASNSGSQSTAMRYEVHQVTVELPAPAPPAFNTPIMSGPPLPMPPPMMAPMAPPPPPPPAPLQGWLAKRDDGFAQAWFTRWFTLHPGGLITFSQVEQGPEEKHLQLTARTRVHAFDHPHATPEAKVQALKKPWGFEIALGGVHRPWFIDPGSMMKRDIWVRALQEATRSMSMPPGPMMGPGGPCGGPASFAGCPPGPMMGPCSGPPPGPASYAGPPPPYY